MRWLMAVPAALLTLTGCSDVSARTADAQDPAAVAPAGVVAPVLATQRFGVVDGMLSVVVRNTSDRALRHADAQIVARDASGATVATAGAVTNKTCCSVVDLPAGATFGFYVDIGAAADRIDSVELTYREVSWAPPTSSTRTRFGARAVGLEADDQGTVVVAEVRTHGAPVAQARAQAFLTDADGRFLAVVSGRWDCFVPGSREIRMQLFHAVPPGTEVESVRVQPVTDDAERPDPTCPSTAP